MTPAEIVAAAFMALAVLTMDRLPVCTFNRPQGYALEFALWLPACGNDVQAGDHEFVARRRGGQCVPRRPA